MTWWQKGVRFSCQGSGQCCLSRGEYGFVFLTLEDRQRLARHHRLTTSAFTRRYCQKYHGAYHLKEDGIHPECIFLKGKQCGVYEARPTQCRTWPFWPEVMNAKAWKKEVAAFCPGVGKGPLIGPEEIQQSLDAQETAERAIIRQARAKN